VGKGTDFAQFRQDCCAARLAVSKHQQNEANNADCQRRDDYGESLQSQRGSVGQAELNHTESQL
jgi:hypothetical protein